MPTIAEQLAQLAQIKADIKDAIEAKGETVGSDALSTYATHISNISGGGGDNLPAFINNTLTEVTVENGVTTLRSYVLTGLTSLVRLTLPSTITTINDYAFYNCQNLEQVNIPSSVTQIKSGVFQNCYKLPSIDLSSGTTSIGANAFVNCRALTSITIPSLVTSIGGSAFNGATRLTTIICKATTPPTITANTFGNGNNNYTGRNSYSAGTNKVYVPNGKSSAYSTAWSGNALLDSTKCGFTIAELDANGNIPT